MTNKRMFNKNIVESDAFLDMPATAQLLYFHLSLNADDYGVVPNPKTIQRLAGCNNDDLKILMAKRFVLAHKCGVIVIKHWRINNVMRSDRLKDSVYEEVLEDLRIKENGAYTDDLSQGEPIIRKSNGNQLTTKRQPNDNQLTTKCPPKLNQTKLNQTKQKENKEKEINLSSKSNTRLHKGDGTKNAVGVDNSVENLVDNSDEPVGKPDSIVSRLSNDEDGLIPRDRLTPASLSHSSSDFSICNYLSDSEWQKLENRYDNLVGLLNYVDDAIRRREDQRPIRSPVGYISSIATQAGWPRKQKGGAESGK